MSFQALVFDLDGTLLDTLDDIADSANRVLASRGFPIHPHADYRAFIGKGVHRLVRRILPPAHQDEATVHACIEAYAQEYAHHWNVRTKPYPGVPEMLDGLVNSRLKLAVLSNKLDRFTQQCVRELLPKWIFDVVLGASDAFPPKPDPASAMETARRLGIPPAQCLYLGDSGVDMQTARAAGMRAVGALWGFRDRDELLRDGAELLVERPTEILELLGRDN